jgi:hypothetical protein
MRSGMRQIALLLMLGVNVYAQLNQATLTGVVSDPSGAAVVNAKVNAVHVATNAAFSTVTTATGNYTLPALEIGEYRVEVEAPGFKREVRPSITLESGATVRLDFTLELGQISESVQVNATATALETESTRISTNLTSKLVEDIPLEVSGQIRNVFDLAVVLPEAKTGANGQYRIGGGQTASWDMTMDGSSVTSASTNYQTERAPISSAPVDAINEFSVTTSGMKAEYGRAMGVISFTTKSGTNQFHGTGCPGIFCRKHAGLEAERLWGHFWRSGVDSKTVQRQEQDVLFRLLRRVPQSQRRHAELFDHSAARHVYRRLQRLDQQERSDPGLRSGLHHFEFGWQNLYAHSVHR